MYLAKIKAAPAPQAWGERELRRMLRDLRRPHKLETQPLARFLSEYYALESPYEACVRLIRDTFVNAGLVGKKLYDLIHKCDIDASSTLLAAASDMGLSPRQFFRYRHEAIVALAAHVNQLSGARPAPASAVEQLASLLIDFDPCAAEGVYGLVGSQARGNDLARLDAALGAGRFIDDAALAKFRESDRRVALLRIARTAYSFGSTSAADAIVDDVRRSLFGAVVEERELVDYEMLTTRYVREVHRGALDRCVQLAREMRRAAEGHDGRTIYAILVEAEAALRSGDLRSAEEIAVTVERSIVSHKQLRLVAILVVLRSAIAFMRGDLERAASHIHSARLALADRPFDAMTINAFIGRLSLASGLAWRAPRELLEAPECTPCTLSLAKETGTISIETSRRLVFQRLYLKAVDLRAAFLAGELETNVEIADLHALANEAGYEVIKAMASVLFAKFADRAGDPEAAQRYNVAAWEIAVTLGDFFLGRDLFWSASDLGREFGAVDLDEAFLAAFYRAMSRRYPTVELVSTPATREQSAFWRSIVLAALRDEELAATACERIRKQPAAFVSDAAQALALLVAQEKRERFIENLKRHKSVT